MNGQPSPYSEVPVVSKPAQVALTVDRMGHGRIVVNGIDLSSVVQSTQIYSRAGRPTEVELVIPAASLTADMEAVLLHLQIEKPYETDTFTLGGEAGAEQE